MRKLFLFAFVVLLSLSAFAQQSRHFTFHYAFSVQERPARTEDRDLVSRRPIPTNFRT